MFRAGGMETLMCKIPFLLFTPSTSPHLLHPTPPFYSFPSPFPPPLCGLSSSKFGSDWRVQYTATVPTFSLRSMDIQCFPTLHWVCFLKVWTFIHHCFSHTIFFSSYLSFLIFFPLLASSSLLLVHHFLTCSSGRGTRYWWADALLVFCEAIRPHILVLRPPPLPPFPPSLSPAPFSPLSLWGLIFYKGGWARNTTESERAGILCCENCAYMRTGSVFSPLFLPAAQVLMEGKRLR